MSMIFVEGAFLCSVIWWDFKSGACLGRGTTFPQYAQKCNINVAVFDDTPATSPEHNLSVHLNMQLLGGHLALPKRVDSLWKKRTSLLGDSVLGGDIFLTPPMRNAWVYVLNRLTSHSAHSQLHPLGQLLVVGRVECLFIISGP